MLTKNESITVRVLNVPVLYDTGCVVKPRQLLEFVIVCNLYLDSKPFGAKYVTDRQAYSETNGLVPKTTPCTTGANDSLGLRR